MTIHVRDCNATFGECIEKGAWEGSAPKPKRR